MKQLEDKVSPTLRGSTAPRPPENGARESVDTPDTRDGKLATKDKVPSRTVNRPLFHLEKESGI